jgi:hypothetical protein
MTRFGFFRTWLDTDYSSDCGGTTKLLRSLDSDSRFRLRSPPPLSTLGVLRPGADQTDELLEQFLYRCVARTGGDNERWSTDMRSTVKTLLLTSALAIGTTAAFAQSYSAERYNSETVRYTAHRAFAPVYGDRNQGWPRDAPYGLGPLYKLDRDTCMPGACRDNPYYP